ncbi:MAG TPA: hypothetical protein VKG64_03090 [Methylomirabilota bacterium]|nr:hypothetical protein [Methylomirabilota bacterium]
MIRMLIGLSAFTALAVGIALAHRGDVETARRQDADASWTAHLHVLDDALARGDISAAVHAWHDANAAALASRRWDALVEVGDAFLEIGRATGTPSAAKPNARLAYLAALGRANAEKSVDGVLRVAEAFEKLGDHEVSRQCLKLAERLRSQG